MTNWIPELSAPYFLAIAAIVFAHACFQLAISVLTLLSSHTIGAGRKQAILLRLCGSYLLGAISAVFVTLTSLAMLVDSWPANNPQIIWLVLAGFSASIGLLTIAFYYRKRKGTALWVPRVFATYLTRRTKRTKSSVEAFALGVMTVIAELPFTLVAMLMIAFMIRSQTDLAQLTSTGSYALLTSLPLLFVAGMITSGHKISTVQRWREANKTFLQWSSGLTLILVGVYLAVLQLGGGVA